MEFPNIQLTFKALSARIEEYIKVRAAQGNALKTSVSGLPDVVLFTTSNQAHEQKIQPRPESSHSSQTKKSFEKKALCPGWKSRYQSF
jgi:hypothetical protein